MLSRQSKHQPYQLTAEATEREAGAPVGTIIDMDSGLLADSKSFPGTTREWWVYVPAQYDAAVPCNLLLCFDGGGPVKSGVLMDNLIHKNAIPPTVVVGITPGRNPDYKEQRSLEYDTVTDANATFLGVSSSILHDTLPPLSPVRMSGFSAARVLFCLLTSYGSAADHRKTVEHKL
eukprot:SAG31_NODE_8407_length_1457_cov_1.983800_2_plen_176_part_00